MDTEALLRRLGQRCRALRQERQLTLRALAAQARLSPRFLVQVEAGEGNISVRNLAHLAQALGTSPSALLAADDGPAHLPVVALLGLRGAGKTSLGRRLARRLRVPFVELDRRIEEAASLSLPEIFSLHGEQFFRRQEREALERVLAERRPLVLATSGGIVTAGDTWAALRARAFCVWLRARPEDHWNRVVQQGDRRPMRDHPEALAELRRLLDAREPLYAQAQFVVDTSRLDLDASVQLIADRLSAAGARG